MAALYCARRLALYSLVQYQPSKGVTSFPLRASNEGLLRPRVARAQKIISLHPAFILRRIRRHEHEDFETLACVILHAVFFPGWRRGPLPRTQHLFL
jgi:hypothetical protein